MSLKNINEITAQNWLVGPVALALNESNPANLNEQKWQIALSGIGMTDIKGQGNDWTETTLTISGPERDPINHIIQHYHVPIPTDTPYEDDQDFKAGVIYPLFQVEYIVPFVALSSIFDQSAAVNAGFSLNSWKPSHFKTLMDSRPNGNAPMLKNIYQGIEAVVAVRDSDAWIYRISYHITLIGKIVFAKTKKVS